MTNIVRINVSENLSRSIFILEKTTPNIHTEKYSKTAALSCDARTIAASAEIILFVVFRATSDINAKGNST